MRAREAGGRGEVVDVERLGVARVGEVLGAQQVAAGRDEEHLDNLLIEPRVLEIEVALDPLHDVVVDHAARSRSVEQHGVLRVEQLAHQRADS